MKSARTNQSSYTMEEMIELRKSIKHYYTKLDSDDYSNLFFKNKEVDSKLKDGI